jgi:hypothetical protein
MKSAAKLWAVAVEARVLANRVGGVMKIFLGIQLVLLVALLSPAPCAAQGESNLSVVKFSWSHYHPALAAEPDWDAPPDYRQRSDRDKAMAQIQYGDMMKSQALKKAERDAARSAVNPGQIFVYKVKLQNTSAKTIKNLYWEYQIIESANQENLSARQFYCASQMKTNQQTNFEVFSLVPPTTAVISTKTLAGDAKNPFEEKAVINRIEYKDGSVWQRSDWIFPELFAASLAARKREVGEPTCRSF